jgi:hypothetical protein
MARIFNKKIKGLKIFNQLDENINVIYQIDWIYELEDSDLDMCKHITVSTEIDTSDLSTFIPYEDVTEADLISWIDNTVTLETISLYKDQLNSKIDKLSNGMQEIVWRNT